MSYDDTDNKPQFDDELVPQDNILAFLAVKSLNNSFSVSDSMVPIAPFLIFSDKGEQNRM